MKPDERELMRRWVEQWRETGPLLHKIRYAELAAQTPAESRQAAYDMLQLADILPRDKRREESSGLIEMQAHFAKWRERQAR